MYFHYIPNAYVVVRFYNTSNHIPSWLCLPIKELHVPLLEKILILDEIVIIYLLLVLHVSDHVIPEFYDLYIRTKNQVFKKTENLI